MDRQWIDNRTCKWIIKVWMQESFQSECCLTMKNISCGKIIVVLNCCCCFFFSIWFDLSIVRLDTKQLTCQCKSVWLHLLSNNPCWDLLLPHSHKLCKNIFVLVGMILTKCAFLGPSWDALNICLGQYVAKRGTLLNLFLIF